MSESDHAQAGNRQSAAAQGVFGSVTFRFWLFVWLGIALAGGLFGLLVGLIVFVSGSAEEQGGGAIVGAEFGLVVGLLFAGIVAIPVVLIVATALWTSGVARLRTFLAIIAGGATGLFCTVPIAANFDSFGFRPEVYGVPFVALATLLGSLGGWVATVSWARRWAI